jgi:hypothetical protein
MKIPRLDYDPASALNFYEESLSALGALCERTWHDRLEVVAEGQAAKLWNQEGALHEQELLFAPADAVGARDALREVFPGCPLTFQLFEALRPSPLVLEKIVLSAGARNAAPDRNVLEKLWHAQYPATRRWRPVTEFKTFFHFSLVAIVRAEIQAIDQHWTLHRVALSLPGGEPDEQLARELPFLEVASDGQADLKWPSADPGWWPSLHNQLETEFRPDVESVRLRQQQYLQREIERLDAYYAHYEQELTQRGSRGGAASTVKTAERLAAARAEHSRRRLDQVARHEICVQAHIDALLLVAEPCWQTSLEVEEQRAGQMVTAAFVPRTRRWFK